jgi:hypothetical protein
MSRAVLTVAAVVLAFVVARLTVATEPVRAEATAARIHEPRNEYQPVAPKPTMVREDTAAEPIPTRESAPNVAQSATQLVDAALARGRWSTADRLEITAMLGQLSEADQNVVLSKLFTSINAGRLDFESTPL